MTLSIVANGYSNPAIDLKYDSELSSDRDLLPNMKSLILI